MKCYYSLIMLAFAAITACSGEKKNESTEDAVETVLPAESNDVTVMILQPSDFNHELVSNGKLTARKLSDLRFQSSEPIATILVKNGDRVQKGQKLAELDLFRIKNKTIQSKDALERARLELQDVLIGQGYAPEDSAQVPEATMKLARVKSGYDQSLAQYNLAIYEEKNATLTAPFDGVVANLFARIYNTASISDVFCTIIDPNSLEASFTVLESELPLIKVGDKVEVTPFSQTNVKTEGRISEINPLVNTDGMVQVKATVNGNNKLFEGMNVRVSVHRSLPDQLVVPKTAIVLRSGKQVLFTLKSGVAIWNYVQTGLENASEYIVSGETLLPGDTVITTGNINLAHEAPVKIIGN